LKSVRAANYITTLRRDLLKVSEACGVEHPALIGSDSVEILENLSEGRLLHEVYGYQQSWGYPSPQDQARLLALMETQDEAEVETEGPPEVAEEGERGDVVGGDEPTLG